MNKLILSIAMAAMSIVAMAQAPAFPGAEGHGRYVTGGRGGQVRHVTNLNDSGTGSLREAVKGSTKKIVVFDVAGVIALKSNLKIGANTTIEGQTAPAPGITVRYYTTELGGNNIIVRFMRFRRGQEKDVNDGADTFWGRNYTGIIIDHCSMSWSIDEIGSFYDNNNFTLQWCVYGEALCDAGHGKGDHSYGGIWGGKLASFHHNYLGFMQNRVPRFNGARYNWTGYISNKERSNYNWENTVQAENVDLRNCVMYNWGTGGCYGGPGGGYVNIVNNYYKAGPGTKNRTVVTTVTVATASNSENTPFLGMTSRYYINGNYVTAATNPANYDWSGVKYDNGTLNKIYSKDPNYRYGRNIKDTVNQNGIHYVKIRLDEEAPKGDVTTHTAEKAYEAVLGYAGASLYRDAVDASYMEQTKNGTALFKGSNGTTTKGIIDFATDNANYYNENTPGWGLTKSEKLDSDNDGMPDDWEKANGLNPNDASDASTYTVDNQKQWYTNVEVYCNSLVEDIMKAGNADGTANFEEYYPSIATGIQTVVSGLSNTSRHETYNLSGQRVGHDYKGIVIRNGKKFIQK
jgi:hypothetical protein